MIPPSFSVDFLGHKCLSHTESSETMRMSGLQPNATLQQSGIDPVLNGLNAEARTPCSTLLCQKATV
jgi:hypothetical protein